MFFILSFFIGLSFLFNQDHIDGIIAIVGDNVVLKSDILEQTALLARQKNINPQKSPLAFERLFTNTLEKKINSLVVLSVAKQDSFISVSFEDINNNIDERIRVFVDLFGSEEALEDTMKLSIKEIKTEFWSVVEEELFIEKLKYLNFGSISIGRQEVVSFFENSPDSLPVLSPLVELSLIQHPVEVGTQTKDSLLTLARTLIDSINTNQLSFEDVARRYSNDPGSAKSGGDLNYTKRGSLLPEYEKVAFLLNVGEVSSPIETVFGIHIIKLVDRVGEKIHTKHILFNLKPGEGDLKNIYKKINLVLEASFNNPAVFDSVALEYFDKHKNLSGYYVDFDKSKFPTFIQNQISLLNDYSFSPLFLEGGFVFALYKYTEQKSESFNLEKDWFIIEQIALNNKKNMLFNLWIEKQKKDLYIKTFSY